jgi:hypothetical protein
MLYRFTSRPTPMVWLSAQYRLYDYDNRTPHFAVDQYVRLDGNVTTSATGGSEPFDMTRHFLDVDASVTPAKFVALRAGYGRQSDERTYRVYETTVEQTLRASIDSTGFSWGSARLQYEHSKRRGEGLDEEVLSDIGEQVSLRQFDISDRTRDRVSAILQVNPTDMVGVSASFGIGREQRPDVAFGLQDNDLTSFTIGVDVTPRNDVNVGLSYGFENLATLQKSRQASPGPQFNDPTRDWTTDLKKTTTPGRSTPICRKSRPIRPFGSCTSSCTRTDSTSTGWRRTVRWPFPSSCPSSRAISTGRRPTSSTHSPIAWHSVWATGSTSGT